MLRKVSVGAAAAEASAGDAGTWGGALTLWGEKRFDFTARALSTEGETEEGTSFAGVTAA